MHRGAQRRIEGRRLMIKRTKGKGVVIKCKKLGKGSVLNNGFCYGSVLACEAFYAKLTSY